MNWNLKEWIGLASSSTQKRLCQEIERRNTRVTEQDRNLHEKIYPHRGAESVKILGPDLAPPARLSTCVATALLPPGGHVALVTAAADSAADLCPLLQQTCCSVLTWPAAQCCRRHRALQLRGGEWVGHVARAHCRLEAVRQLTLDWGTQRRENRLELFTLAGLWVAECYQNPGPFLTCLIVEWWADTGLCCIAALTCLYCWDTSISLLDSEEEEEEVVLDTEGEEEEEEDAACWRMRCSISCSCWSALTKAAFSRLVCSAFRAFFWLEDMHWSQRMFPAFSFLQREVKSVLHWAQVYGSLGIALAMAAAGPRLPMWTKQI